MDILKMKEFISFPNLEKYSISYLENIFTNNQIFIAQHKIDELTELTKVILLFNLKNSNTQNILDYVRTNNIPDVTIHENIITINEIGTTYNGFDQYLYLVMDYEFFYLKSLETYSNKKSLEEIIKAICQTLEGLIHLHNSNILHGNITSDNILYSSNKVKLSDLHLSFTPFNYDKNRQKILLSYKSPDFLIKKCTYLSDIHSIGMLLFRFANRFKSWHETINQVDDLVELVKTNKLIDYIGYQAHIDREIKDIINKACRLKNSYYSSLFELKQDLEMTFNIKY